MLTHLSPVGLLAGVRSRTGTKSLWSENVLCDRQRDRPRDRLRDRPHDGPRDRPTRFLAALGVHQLLPMVLKKEFNASPETSGSPSAKALKETCSLESRDRTFLLWSPGAKAIHETCSSESRVRSSLSGRPRAKILNETCSYETRDRCRHRISLGNMFQCHVRTPKVVRTEAGSASTRGGPRS